jgi:hypothetical protein
VLNGSARLYLRLATPISEVRRAMDFFGLDIDNHSGHLSSLESLQIGKDAFAAAGIHLGASLLE